MGSLGDFFIRLGAMGPADVLDILLVTALIFAVLYFVRGTRAVQLLRGILLVVLIVTLFSRLARLPTFSSIVRTALPALLISIPIIFQPELRRMMERLGRAGQIRGRPAEGGASDAVASIVALAARRLSERRYGALMVLERETGLDDLCERGVRLDAEASVDLLTQLFYPNTPLHDGAVILRDGRVVAARVVLPLGDVSLEDEHLGTRHLAAASVSESTDALAVVVSEETGEISLAVSGRLITGLDEGTLSRRLRRDLAQPTSTAGRFLGPIFRATSFDLVGRSGGGSTTPAPEKADAAGDSEPDDREGDEGGGLQPEEDPA